MNKYDASYYKVKNYTKYVCNSIRLALDKSTQEILAKNRELFNTHKGERCFIIGCGPSLNDTDLELLADEFTFTVNYFMKSPMYELVRSDCHLLMDPIDFVDDRIKELENINYKNIKPLCFVPVQSKNKIMDLGLDKILNIRYLYCCYSMYEGFNRKMDLSKVCTSFPNSVLYCTMIAIYMGFKEIIYIGCDMTGYEQLSIVAGKNIQLHAYAMDEEEKRRIIETHQEIDNESFFQGFMNTFAGFRKLREYAEKRDICLLNATKGGVLNEIKRVDYESLFI